MTSVGKDAENLEHLYVVGEMVQPLWKTIWTFLKKKIELPDNSIIPLLGICLIEPKSGSWRDIYTPRFIAALFTIAKIWN